MDKAKNQHEAVLITGTSRGIGRFLARHFIRTGERVFGCSRSGGRLIHPRYTHFTVDVEDEQAVRGMIRDIRNRCGRLDVLINNAGAASMNLALLTPTPTARKILNTNVLGTFIVCREAARLMQKNRYGRIVNIGSVAVPMQLEGEALYAASKSAVVSLTQILARELAPFRITCNVVGPGPVETGLIRGLGKERIHRLLNRMAIKRLCRFEEIAHAIDFFVSRASDGVTGQVLYLGGP